MLDIPVTLNLDGLLANLRRQGTPDRVYYLELFLDQEIHEALRRRFGIGLDIPDDAPFADLQRAIALYRFLGYESIYVQPRNFEFPRTHRIGADPVVGETARTQRTWNEEDIGVIGSREDFEKYPWPDPAKMDLSRFEWLEKNLPDDMCVQVHTHAVFEQTSWLLGYMPLCYKLYDEPDLVDAMFERVGALLVAEARVLSQFECVKLAFGGDDMGFKGGCLISPQALIEKCLPWHKRLCEVYRAAGCLNILHCCGNTRDLMPALLDDVGYDGFHSFEDTIELVTDAKREYGHRAAVIGGIDVDFLCRADEEAIRRRVRDTLAVCQPGGGYCLGSGNSVANYVPVDHYLAMLDEGRRWTG
jgi:uroporphyrinogen decarboxylase